MSRQIRISDEAYEVIAGQAVINRRRILADQVDAMVLPLPSKSFDTPTQALEQLLSEAGATVVDTGKPKDYSALQKKKTK